MARIEKQVTLTGEYSFTRRAFSGYRDEQVNIYKMTDAEGKVYVWKTTNVLMWEKVLGKPEDAIRDVDMYAPSKGDTFIIRATVKGETEYKGEPQTEVNRVKVTEIVSKYVEAKAEKQKQSVDLKAGDSIIEMPYGNYKKHYADCETIEGSYDDEFRTIKVIVRAGRMKPSGTRGEHYKGYELVNENGEHVTYRAVNADNALKRAKKEYPAETWEIEHIYDYRCVPKIW